MKKLLLPFFLFLSFTIYAQVPPGMFPAYELCDDAVNDGVTTFDLLSTNPIVSLGLDPAIHTVTFHPSDADAANDVNVISNPSAYTNTVAHSQTIGIRMVNTTTNEVHVSGMDLIVNPLPLANPGSLAFCEIIGVPSYFLPQADAQVTGGSPSTFVSYYASLTDAQAGINPLPNLYTPTIDPGTETLYARVGNVAGCFSITTLTLNTNNCNSPCPAPTALAVNSITFTSATISWSGGTNTTWQYYLIPMGSTPPPLNVFFTITTQSNSFIITGLSPQTCYAVYVRTVCSNTGGNTSDWTGPVNFCTYDCTNNGQCPENLTLSAFLDTNNNGVKDSGEVDFNNGTFVYDLNDSGTPSYGYANSGLFYIFDSNPVNSYDLSFVVNPGYTGYFSSTAAYANVTLPSGSGMNTYYFPITQLQPFNDLEVHIMPSGTNPRPGFSYTNYIMYKNNGTQTVASGTISFTKNPLVTINGISESGTTTTATGFDYTFSNLAPNESRMVYVSMQTPTIPTVTLGDILTNSVMIQPVAGDAFPASNAASLSQVVMGSYDPNEKSESHGGKIGLDTFTNNDYLYYTIQFENTGSAAAEFIRVEDMLDADLDESTFEMISASHIVNTKREGHGLTWHFYNINLPPTVSNPSSSHGYVYFRIKPKAGYAAGDIIPNTASIYFDYNPAIVTEAFNTEFFTTLGNPSFADTDFQLYPNPARTAIHIVQKDNALIEKITFYDVTGKVVKQIQDLGNVQTSIDISALAKGIYFVEITTENHLKQTKKLIIQ